MHAGFMGCQQRLATAEVAMRAKPGVVDELHDQLNGTQPLTTLA